MPSISSLIHNLSADYPAITFTEGVRFSWSPSEHTVTYVSGEANAEALLLHELSHGLLEHARYSKDIELLSMEVAAWENAKELAQHYEVVLHDEAIETHLDSYRDWLHDRSTCPACSATGYQTSKDTYTCPACAHSWRVNEARICALRRYSL